MQDERFLLSVMGVFPAPAALLPAIFMLLASCWNPCSAVVFSDDMEDGPPVMHGAPQEMGNRHSSSESLPLNIEILAAGRQRRQKAPLGLPSKQPEVSHASSHRKPQIVGTRADVDVHEPSSLGEDLLGQPGAMLHGNQDSSPLSLSKVGTHDAAAEVDEALRDAAHALNAAAAAAVDEGGSQPSSGISGTQRLSESFAEDQVPSQHERARHAESSAGSLSPAGLEAGGLASQESASVGLQEQEEEVGRAVVLALHTGLVIVVLLACLQVLQIARSCSSWNQWRSRSPSLRDRLSCDIRSRVGNLPVMRATEIVEMLQAATNSSDSTLKGEPGGASALSASDCLVKLEARVEGPLKDEPLTAPLSLKECVYHTTVVSPQLHDGVHPVPVSCHSNCIDFVISCLDDPSVKVEVRGADITLFGMQFGRLMRRRTFAEVPNHWQKLVLDHWVDVRDGGSGPSAEQTLLTYEECFLPVGTQVTITGRLCKAASGRLALRPLVTSKASPVDRSKEDEEPRVAGAQPETAVGEATEGEGMTPERPALGKTETTQRADEQAMPSCGEKEVCRRVDALTPVEEMVQGSEKQTKEEELQDVDTLIQARVLVTDDPTLLSNKSRSSRFR